MKYKINWEEMYEFKGIDLFDSFVSSWSNKVSIFKIKLEVSIWPESKFYSKTVSDEYTCYKSGVLEFNNFSSIKGNIPIESVKPTTDPDGTLDYGNIEYFVKEKDGFEIHGEFGKVFIKSGTFEFRINT